MNLILHKLMSDAGVLLADLYHAVLDFLEGEQSPPAMH